MLYQERRYARQKIRPQPLCSERTPVTVRIMLPNVTPGRRLRLPAARAPDDFSHAYAMITPAAAAAQRRVRVQEGAQRTTRLAVHGAAMRSAQASRRMEAARGAAAPCDGACFLRVHAIQVQMNQSAAQGHIGTCNEPAEDAHAIAFRHDGRGKRRAYHKPVAAGKADNGAKTSAAARATPPRRRFVSRDPTLRTISDAARDTQETSKHIKRSAMVIV